MSMDSLDRTGTLHKSEDDLLQLVAKSDSFWDIGNYRRVVKRMEDGARLCNEFVKMAQERAEIEAKYVRNLQAWSKKWEDAIGKGPEYGTYEMGWKASCREAARLAEVHVEIQRKIQDEITENVQSWKSQHYHKSLIHFKETKKVEESFARAQKPWAKRLQKSVRAKKAYHQTARELEVQQASLHAAESNPDFSSEQCSKIREKRDRAQKEVDKSLDKYKERLSDLQHYQSRYIEDMTIQYNKCQEAEQERMEFFRNILENFRHTLDLSSDDRVMSIYDEYSTTLSRISPEDDLQWYTVNCGTDMAYNWPVFEEYFPSSKAATLLHQRRTSSSIHNGHPHHTLHTKRSDGSSLASSSSNSPALNSSIHSGGSRGTSPLGPLPPPPPGDEVDGWLEPPPEEETTPVVDSVTAAAVEEEEEEQLRESSEEPQGKLMRALYDYSEGSEDDLVFKEGDLVRIMFEGSDGWAEGQMGEKYGYVPISYFEEI